MASIQAYVSSAKVAAPKRGKTVVVRSAAPLAASGLKLPQNDTDIAGRQAMIASQQQLLQWDHEFLPGCALVKNVPQFEAFSPTYGRERKAIEDDLMPNAFAVQTGLATDPLDEIKDYEDFFKNIPLPKIAAVYQTDESFAEQRLSGANPLAIERLKPTDPRAAVIQALNFDDAPRPYRFMFQANLKQGKLFVCDYTGTHPDHRGPAGVKGASSPFKKYLPKPLVFFRFSKSENKLKVIAIQINASANPTTYTPTKGRVYTPAEANKNDWFFAKICAQVADGNHHEMCTHLARCHFTMEPVAVAAGRQLAQNHPLSVLLRVHMRFHMANNFLAHGTFFKPKEGNLENLLPGTFPETVQLIQEGYASWGLKKHSFLTEMKTRGVDNTEVLTHYPYRDDGMLLWNAISTYVTSYVSSFYSSDVDVAADKELQAFCTEAADQVNGGKVKEMPTSITTKSELASILTTIIFLCGPIHSAVNFAQLDYISFPANMPLSSYLPIEELAKQTTPITDSQILAMLPPFIRAMEQVNVIHAIARYHFDTLGFYDKSLGEMYGKTTAEVFGGNAGVTAALAKFQADLSAAEATIIARNATRPVKYEVMLPSQVMNSVSI